MKIWLVSALSPYPDVAGPVVLYRHFKRLKGCELRVITHEYASPYPNDANWDELRINYSRLSKLIPRFFFRKYFHWLGEELLSIYIYHKIKKEFKKNRPDIILSTWFSTFLIPAYKISKKYNIPLALICHDDLESGLPNDFITRYLSRRKLGRIYRHAQTRFCVSEGMENLYNRYYHALGVVLYPIGGNPDTNIVHPEVKDKKKLVFGYFGSVNSAGKVLLDFAKCLEGGNHDLRLTGPAFPTGLFDNQRNVSYAGFFSSRSTYLQFIRDEIDVCILAQSFDDQDRILMQSNFPSKLIDMLGYGKPILVIAPEYSSSYMFAVKHEGNILYQNTISQQSIQPILEKLKQGYYRETLAKKTADIYKSEFNPDAIHKLFMDKLPALNH